MKRKTITIEDEIYKRIEEHNKKYGSTVTSVIRLALIKFFEIKYPEIKQKGANKNNS